MRKRALAVLAIAFAMAASLAVCPDRAVADESVDAMAEEQPSLVETLSSIDDGHPSDDGAAQHDVVVKQQDVVVASIGDITYSNIDEAFAALGSSAESATLVLKADVQIGNTKNMGASPRDAEDGATRTIDLNGHSITFVGNEGDSAVYVQSGTCRLTNTSSSPAVLNGRVGVGSYQYGSVDQSTGSTPSMAAVFELDGASLTIRNTRGSGWGVLINRGTFILSNGEISGCAGRGVYNFQGAFHMNGGAICDNKDSGVKSQDGTFVMTGGTICGNTSVLYGGGVFLQGTKAVMEGGTIARNTASRGAGVYVGPVCDFRMTGGTICDNTAEMLTGGSADADRVPYETGLGGGVFAEVVDWNRGDKNAVTPGSTFELEGGTIERNTAKEGGGVYVLAMLPSDYAVDASAHVFLMTGGTISSNVATAGNGGGVYLLEGNAGLAGGAIQDNTAAGLGGGVYLGSTVGTLCLGTAQGTPKRMLVTNSRAGADGHADNAYLADGQVFQMVGPLGNATMVGVTTQATPDATGNNGEVRITSGYQNACAGDDPRSYFLSDNDRYAVAWNQKTAASAPHTEAVLKIATPESVSVAYVGHQQTYGDLDEVRDGNPLGHTGQSKRLEAIRATVSDGSICYRSHLQGRGWESDWAKDGAWSGTSGEARRLEAIQMKLSGAVADGNHVWYRVHVQTYGWLGWTCDGEPAGTTGQSRRVESYEVIVLPDGQVPTGYDVTRPAYLAYVSAQAHMQGIGWRSSSAGLLGTTGQSRRLEAVAFNLCGLPYGGSILYQGHLQGSGWEKTWEKDGSVSGTTGQSRRLEAVRIDLDGEVASHCSVWYRVHSQTFGWGEWAKDGDDAGTTGMSKRAEAIDLLILSQGALPLS